MVQVNRLLRGIRYPGLVASLLNKQYHTRGGRRVYNFDGIDVFEEDWDNLVILDACRYDEFVRCADLPGTTQHRKSRGSASKEFVRGNFAGKDLRDTVYVSANGWYAKLEAELETELFAYRFTDRDILEGLTSHPETVTNEALDAAEKHPHKRLVIHYMQPHRPFLGSTGRDLFDPRQPFVDMMAASDATHEDLRESYRENLDLVLQSVEDLLSTITGKTVITADHGELLGEREWPIPIRHYGHPEGVYIKTLTKVPWHIIEGEKRRTIKKDTPQSTDHDYHDVEKNLKDLGYL